MKSKYDILIDFRVERLEKDIECLDKVCKSLRCSLEDYTDIEIEIELIRNVQADLMFVIDNLKYEKQLKTQNYEK